MDASLIQVLVQLSAIVMGCNILMTFIVMRARQKRKKRLLKIESVFADQVSKYLYPIENNKVDSILISKELRKVGIKEGNSGNVQFLIRLMILTQRALGGKNHLKIKKLYEEIPPYRVSIAKVRSKKWLKIAQGIREIYEMDQSQYIKEIAPFFDHKNTYVRREAQIAMVVFLGWESLRFLPYLTRRISLWQQIKIVEKLHDIDKSPILHYLRRNYKSTNPDTLQLIIRIIKKYQIISESDFLLEMLGHEDYEVRESAIYALLSLGVRHPHLRQLLFRECTCIPSEIQQTQLLKYLYKNTSFRNNLFANEMILEKIA